MSIILILHDQVDDQIRKYGYVLTFLGSKPMKKKFGNIKFWNE